MNALDLQTKRLREPIAVAPFLEWCSRREEQIRRELDALPALSFESSEVNPQARLLLELGWEGDSGARRLYRWRYDNLSGLVERADVEDAMHHAGVAFNLFYPLESELCGRLGASRFGIGRNMTDGQVLAAHTVYVRGRMSTTSLAELIYERFGYRSAEACAKSLSVAFRGLGLPVRQCERMVGGRRCARTPLAGSDFCCEHGRLALRPSQIGGRRAAMTRVARAYHPTADLLAQARVMRLEMGMTWRHIACELLPQTPWGSSDHLSSRLSVIARAEGWDAHRDAVHELPDGSLPRAA